MLKKVLLLIIEKRGIADSFRKYLFLILMFAASTLGLVPGQSDGSEWSLGTPIVTYWDGPILDDRVAHQAINGGFNLVWIHSIGALDIAEQHNLRGLWYGALDDATIAQIRHHPALYAYYIFDEPPGFTFFFVE